MRNRYDARAVEGLTNGKLGIRAVTREVPFRRQVSLLSMLRSAAVTKQEICLPPLIC